MAAAAALAMLAGACVSAEPCVRHHLPGFTVCVPPGWTLVRPRAVDSAAGRFSSGALSVSYDFGLYADPLQLPDGASAKHEDTGTVDGKPARQVRYTLTTAGKPTMHYAGVHLSNLGATSMGPLKLTMRAESSDPARLQEATDAFATIRLVPTAR